MLSCILGGKIRYVKKNVVGIKWHDGILYKELWGTQVRVGQFHLGETIRQGFGEEVT